MATISEFQQALKSKFRQSLVTRIIGKELIGKIELAGGKWQFKEEEDSYQLSEIPEKLRLEFDAKLQQAQKRLHDMDQQWLGQIR